MDAKTIHGMYNFNEIPKFFTIKFESDSNSKLTCNRTFSEISEAMRDDDVQILASLTRDDQDDQLCRFGSIYQENNSDIIFGCIESIDIDVLGVRGIKYTPDGTLTYLNYFTS